MTKANRSTEIDPEIPDGLQIGPRHWGTCYIGKRADILGAGILPAELLPAKPQQIDVLHNGRSITGGKHGFGKYMRWELHVHHERRTPELTLIQGGKAASE